MPVRVVVLGPGGAGKSTFSRQLAAATGAEWIEIDALFWQPGLTPLTLPEWQALQERTFRGDGWIADGDLGPHDAVEIRLRHADAVVLLDVPLWRCVWRTLRRSRERRDYWMWVATWRRRWRPLLLEVIARHPDAHLLIVRNAADQQRAFERLASSA
jgi:adenylate kinase family enzyme